MTESLINDLILDYLTMEGYTLAAAKFSKEANLPPQQDTSTIQARQGIISLIHAGQIDQAIESLNDLDPEVRFLEFVLILRKRHLPLSFHT
jgi:glucose-induced degradation protein 8